MRKIKNNNIHTYVNVYNNLGKDMARRTKEEAEETKKAILLAALEIFCEKGYSRTTFDEIAKRINLTKGAIYWHFRNKADILTEIIRKGFLLTHKTIDEKIRPQMGLDAIYEFMQYEAKLISQQKLYKQLMFFLLFQMEWSEAILNKVTKEANEVVEYPQTIIKESLANAKAQGTIKEDTDVESCTCLIIYLWQGIIRNIVKPHSTISYDKLINDSYSLITKSIVKEV